MVERQPIHIKWDWQLQSTPEQLWPFVSNTNQLFKDIRQPSVTREDLSTSELKHDHAKLSYESLKRYEVWTEEPCQWEYPYRFELQRNYHSGPYHNIFIQVDLTPAKNGTLLRIKIRIEPKMGLLPILSTLKLKTIIKKRVYKTFSRYDELAQTGNPAFLYNCQQILTQGSKKKLQEFRQHSDHSVINTELLDKLIRYIQLADDISLERIQPFILAKTWNTSESELLKCFIHSAKEGLLNFQWDICCSRCRKVQATYTSLSQINETAHCDSCQEIFNINFGQSIQVSFSPHPQIRKIDPKSYCVVGPQTKDHVLIQQYLRAGQKRYLKTSLPEGKYILRSSTSTGTAAINVQKDGGDTIYIGIYDTDLYGKEATICTEPNITLENKSKEPQLITLEKAEWNNDMLTAAKVTSLQIFRDLFPEEILKKGEKINVDNLTLMFTDLFDSTGMYHKEGDDKAVGRVIDHFEILQQAVSEENGAIVKTIGDSIMAVFYQPVQALKAYLKAQDLILNDNRFDSSIKLKAGIHHGSCVAVNLNNRIDFFGSTVNIASRLVDAASQNELMISEQSAQDTDLQVMLNTFECEYLIRNITSTLRGFEKESFRMKCIKRDQSALRVAI